MQTTYFNTTTSGTTPAPVIGDSSGTRPVVIRKIIIGNPISSGNLTIFNIGNALSNNTTQIAAKITYPAFSTTNLNDGPDVYDFRASSGSGGGSVESDGLICSTGGCIVIDQTMQVTVFWDYAEGN